MQRAVLYARVGATRKERQAISNQLAVCRAFCVRWGMTVVDEFIDEGFSGRYVDRPAFSSLIASALDEQRTFDVIVVMDRSRFLDDPTFSHTYEDLLRINGVTLKAVSEGRIHIPTEEDADLPYERQRSSYPYRRADGSKPGPESERLVG